VNNGKAGDEEEAKGTSLPYVKSICKLIDSYKFTSLKIIYAPHIYYVIQ
jgi:hypothetical protein